MQTSLLDSKRLAQLNEAIPRYTSYPTAPEWHPLDISHYMTHLQRLEKKDPLSLYIHIPFCHSMCLYCACSVVLNRQEHREEQYVQYLLQEIDQVVKAIGHRPIVKQLHFGGGTPTKITEEQLSRIMDKIRNAFALHPDCEISIEIDPRTVEKDEGRKLEHISALGFNRVSFGVQDTNKQVQEAVRRRQSLEMTRWTYQKAQQLGFTGINVDLIYGLPFQTQETFVKTVSDILEMSPDRIAMYSYAKVPWLKPHQKAIKESTLPSTEEKFAIYCQARKAFIKAGYVAIGMDHFAKKEDAMSLAYQAKSLQRNFQGYSLKLTEDMIGLGITATGFVKGAYFQNQKELAVYYATLDDGKLPLLRGKVLTDDDSMRRILIQKVMCDFQLDMKSVENEFGIDFDTTFSDELRRLENLEKQGLVNIEGRMISATPEGSLFIRNIASVFDTYLHKKKRTTLFSRAI